MNKIKIKNIELAIVSFVWIVLFATPILFREDSYNPVWRSINNQFEILIPVMILFLFNRFLFVPFFLFRKKLLIYILSVSLTILFISVGSNYYDTRIKHPANRPSEENAQNDRPQEPSGDQDGPAKNPARPGQRQPRRVSPFANVIVFSVLMIGLDTGLRSGIRWIEAENEKVKLEKENVATQLVLLRNQVSPHFFMNTLNNIYSLIDSDKERSKESVMKLSKLMRYLLYENQNEKILLSKEFDFVRNYFALMKLRLVEDVEIYLKVPDSYPDFEIPVMLFFPYLENAFKYGTSYQNKSRIEAIFEVGKDNVLFMCRNSKNVFSEKDHNGGTGFRNSRQRLDLLYADRYSLVVNETDDTFSVTLRIPGNMKLRCVVIDDEPLAVDVIARHIEHTPFLTLDQKFTHPVKAFEYLSENNVDILFIDIQMPDISGLELVKKLEHKPVTIFTTAYDNYALEGYRADAVDYLLKPIDYPEFLKAAEKAKKWIYANNEIISVKSDKEFLFIKSEYKIIRIELKTIKYIEGMSEYVRIHRDNAKSIMSLLSLKSLEEQLPEDQFMRVHKSFIINLKRITEIESNIIVFSDGFKIPVSKLYRDKFQEYVNKNFMI